MTDGLKAQMQAATAAMVAEDVSTTHGDGVTTQRRRRRALDFYPTGCGKPGLAQAAAALYRRHPGIHGIGEPCVGTGDLVADRDDVRWINDVDPAHAGMGWNLDATLRESWDLFPTAEWVVTNPPFVKAYDILSHALERATEGVAFLLRLAFLEPTEQRNDLLVARPPTRTLVLPRMSFTGDGKTDSVTCAWMIWSRHIVPGIEIVPRGEVR